MARPVRRPGATGLFVGRSRELEIAADCLAGLMAGCGGALLLAGEPGIGKTGLAEQVESLGAGLGVPAVWGRCAEDEGAPPLWPWRQILSGCRRLQAPGEPEAGMPDLTVIVPEVAGRGEDRTAAAPPGGPDRFRLFQSMTAMIMAAAVPAGLIVVLDDLHWADPLSALLLAHLGRVLATSRVLLVATYRDQGMSAAAPAAGAIAAVAREPETVHLRLGGLAEAEVADQLQATFGRRFDVQVVAGIARRTGGNPFFVTQLGRLLGDATQAGQVNPAAWETELPEGVRAVVGQRLDRLPASCRQVLRTGAVIGAAMDVGTVAAVTGLTVAAVLAELDAACDAGLVRAAPGQPTVGFSHDLVRDTLHAEVPPSRRPDIHRRAAEHIEAAHPGDLDRHAAEIAHHRLSAVPVADAAGAVEWAERAAAHAVTDLAYEDAARLYQRALHAISSGGLNGKDRGRLLLSHAEVLFRSGDVGAAIAAAAQAGEEARRRADPVAMAHAALALEGVADEAWQRQVVQFADAALRQLDTDRTELRARLLAALAVAHSSSLAAGGSDRAGPLSRQALEQAEAAGTPSALVSALRARQMASAGPDGVGDRLEVAERMLAVAADTGDPWAGLWGRLWRLEARCQLGATDAAESDLYDLAHISGLLRQPVADWHLARTRCSLAIGRGRFTDAARYLDEAVRLADQGLDVRAAQIQSIMGGKLAALTGDPYFDQWCTALDRESSGAGREARRVVLVMVLASRGELDEARSHYERLPPWKGWQLPRFFTHVALDQRGRAAALLGDTDGATVAYERLRPWARYIVVGGSGLVAMHGSAELTLGCLAACLGKPELAVRHLRSALAANRQAGLPPFELESQYELARILARRSRREDRSEALALAASVASAASQLGMEPLRSSAERLAGSLRSTAKGSGPAPLTQREREIASLVARGLTNRQVADVLHLAERTAENHVQHILTKLGFQNRTQIAAWAVAQRLGDVARTSHNPPGQR